MAGNQTTATITTRIAGILALTVMVSLPLGFFTVSRQYQAGSLETETAICADIIGMAFSTDVVSMLDETKQLDVLLARPSFTGRDDCRRIISLDNRVIAEHIHPLKGPLLTRTHELQEAGRPVGRLEITRSLYPLIVQTGFVALFSLALGASIFLTLWFLPLRAVRNAEQSLRRSEHRYRTLFEESKDAIIIASQDGQILDANTAAVALFGYSSREEIAAIGHVGTLFSPANRERLEAVLAGDGQLRDFEFSCRKKDGRWVSGLLTVIAGREADGETTTYNIFFHDQTQKKRIELQLVYSRKMEAVGVLAGGVAHDFNSILTIIIGFAEILQKRMGDDDPLRRYLNGMLAATERASHLVKGLLTFSRTGAAKPQLLDLKKVIFETGKLLGMIVGDRIDVSVTVADHELPVMADRELLQQVFMNLITNARDAMPEGGTVTISAAQMAMDEHSIERHGFGTPGRYVAIAVSDTGYGMEKEVAEKVFEPFFTTKEVGKGSGLGLSIVYGIVKQHHGYIAVQSDPGAGAVFTVYLPLLATPD
jgi:PAS domain S-box-containing protein